MRDIGPASGGAVRSIAKTGPWFTIIELLVVVGIIAILAAILLPALSKAKDVAVRSSCANNMKQIYLQTNHYTDDWNDWNPMAPWRETAFFGGNYYNFSWPSDNHFVQRIQTYFEDKPASLSYSHVTFRCPAQKAFSNQNSNKGPGSYGTPQATWLYCAYSDSDVNQGRKLHNCTSPTATILLTDAATDRGVNCTGLLEGIADDVVPIYPRYMSFRHSNSIVVLYYGGNADSATMLPVKSSLGKPYGTGGMAQ